VALNKGVFRLYSALGENHCDVHFTVIKKTMWGRVEAMRKEFPPARLKQGGKNL